MKELSVEEKAKAYDEVKARMSKAYNENRCTIGFMNEIFPESKNEDERIMKAIRNLALSVEQERLSILNITQSDILAWLEKQGEHANFRNKIQIGDKVTRNRDGMLVNLSQLNRVAKKDENQEYQKPTEWSEEDKNMLQSILDEYKSMPAEKRNWLKSLKGRFTFKPSEEQINNK